MSREFGGYHSGYFHEQIEGLAIDCLSSSIDLTKLWGKFLKEFYHIAFAISSNEACDHGVDYPIDVCLKKIPELKHIINEIESFLRPYQIVADEAVRKYVEKEAKE